MEEVDVLIVGAGAAGCFAAAVAGQTIPHKKIALLEKTRQPLAKVRISGGGRCNVTHHCFDVQKLLTHYPRGNRFLRNAFSRFHPQQVIDWFATQGVVLKTEKDGRMFPVTDQSETICACLMELIKKQGVALHLECEVEKIEPFEGGFVVQARGDRIWHAKNILYATGGNHKAYALLQNLGHAMIPPVPSLFTFETQETWVHLLSGVVAPCAKARVFGFEQTGPILMTHWGLSGPAILKLSAWAARDLANCQYRAKVSIHWVGEMRSEVIKEELFREKERQGSKKVVTTPLFNLPKQLWRACLLEVANISEERAWAQMSKKEMERLFSALTQTELTITGKSLNKEEFVTCGGVPLDEIDPRTMESKKVPHLYFAGEVMDVDGVTGGFNFQNAWSSAWVAVHAMSV